MSRARTVLRTVLLALALAFAVGFVVGTWLRCAAEQPKQYLGALNRDAEPNGFGAEAARSARPPGGLLHRRVDDRR